MSRQSGEAALDGLVSPGHPLRADRGLAADRAYAVSGRGYPLVTIFRLTEGSHISCGNTSIRAALALAALLMLVSPGARTAPGEATTGRTLILERAPSGTIPETTIPPPPKFNGRVVSGPNIWAGADLRGDGRKDLVLGWVLDPTQPTLHSEPLRILRPKVDGSGFTDVTRALLGSGALPSIQHVREIVVADFNGDGREDTFVADTGYDASPFPGARNSLVLSNGDGTFTDASPGLPMARDYSHSTTVGDIDGDGLLDIFVGNTTVPVSPYFLMGRPGGRFEQVFSNLPAEVLEHGVTNHYYASLLVDVDGDGHLDLVVGTGYSGAAPTRQTVVYYNDGSGDFTKRPRTQFPLGAFGATATVDDIVALDVNDDGRTDLLVLTTQSTPQQDAGMAIQVLVNQGNGVFTDESVARLGASASRTTGFWWAFLQVADLDGDGRLDFFAQGWAQIGVDVPIAWLNNGNGTFTALQAQATFDAEAFPFGAIDVDGDGRPDFVSIYSDADGNLAYNLWLNRTPRTAPSEPVAVSAIAGDGRVALAFKSPLGNGPQPVSGYTATCRPPVGAPRSAAGTASPIVVDGLVNGTRYQCSVRAQMGTLNGIASKPVPAQPHAGLHTVLEFYNPALDHYFITANYSEQVAVAGGAAGADWALTGQRFSAGGLTQVCRFYGSVSPGPNSHFYTIDPNECAALKAIQAQTPASEKRWNFESNDFASTVPSGGQCAAGTTSVWRAYNDGFAKGIDSNHRITSNAHLYGRQAAGGWRGEGVVMCAPESQ